MEREPPQCFTCPVTLDVMRDPVVGRDGHSYERSGVEAALALNPYSPLTRQPMASTDLIPNHALRNAIQEWARNRATSDFTQAQLTVVISQRDRERARADAAEAEVQRLRARLSLIAGEPEQVALEQTRVDAENWELARIRAHMGVALTLKTVRTNEVFTLVFHETASVGEVKKRVARERNFKLDSVNLSYKGRMLSNNATVGDLIQPGSTDHVIVMGSTCL
eukprot:m.35157 g.35157  ORF g.35157 m.35157 type:complete len:222 (+) comp7414_c0_seq1:199-864(+)